MLNLRMMHFCWPFRKKHKVVKKPEYFWKIIHWVYPMSMAAGEGYGIVFDNREEGRPYWRWGKVAPIFGYMIWREDDYPEPTGDAMEVFSTERLNAVDFVDHWHIVENPSKKVLEGIKYSAYLLNKQHLIDNLSLVEILSKLKQYEDSKRVS